MNFSILSQLDYGKGKVLFSSSEIISHNFNISSNFLRKCFELISSKQYNEEIKVLVIYNSTLLNNINDTIFIYKDYDFLSEYNNFEEYDIILIKSLTNNISPIIKSNILDFVDNGGGLFISEADIYSETIYLFEDIAPVFCRNNAFFINSDSVLWTNYGLSSYVFDSEINNKSIGMYNTIYNSDFSSNWEVILYIDDEITGSITVSDADENQYYSYEYDIPGSITFAYFVNEYVNGVLVAKEK